MRALVSTGWRLLSVVKNALILLLFYSSTSLFFIFTHEAYMDRSLNEKKKKKSQVKSKLGICTQKHYPDYEAHCDGGLRICLDHVETFNM